MTPERQKRCFTIMVIPHSEEATFSLRLPLFKIQLFVLFLAIIIAAVGILGYSYLKVSAEAGQVEELRQINRAQQEEIDTLAVETKQAMNQVDELDMLIKDVTEKIDDVEILEDVESLQVRVEETRKEYNSSKPTSPYFESLASNSFGNPAPYAYNSISEQTGTSFATFNHHYTGSSTSGMVLDRAIENIVTLHDTIPEQLDTLDEVETYIGKIEAKVDQMEAKPSLWPARGRITSGFGTRKVPYTGGYQFHTGVDIAGSHGSQIRAAASGKVAFSGYRGSLGNLLIIDHGHGYETYYAHLASFAVRKGDKIEKGQTIGSMGASGRTTGTHLHYEVHYKGSPVNPIRYMEEH